MADNPLGNVSSNDPSAVPNPRAFDVGPQQTGQPQPSAPAPAAAGAAPASAVPQPNPAVASDVQHHYGIGKAFKSLLGDQQNYQVDPNTGQMVATPAKRNPGALMRGILAGALLGSAAGSETPGNGYSGFARGAAASIQDSRNQDLMKQKQAQQDFENQLKAKRAGTEDNLLKAQIAHYNAQTVRENQLIQGTDREFHEKSAAYGKTQMQPFIDAGLPYQFKDMSESQMNGLIKDNPNAGNLLWEPTGTKIVTDKDGKVGMEMTYSAVDPKGKVKVTDAQIKQWKEDGLDQVYGSRFSDLAKDKELSASDYMTISAKGQELGNKALTKRKQDFDLEKEKASIDLTKADAAYKRAEVGKIQMEVADQKAATEARAELRKANGDLSKLSLKSQEALSKEWTNIQNSVERQIHELPKDASGNPLDQARASKLYDTIDSYQAMQDKLNGVQRKEQSQGGTGTPTLPSMDKDAQDYVANNLNDRLGKAQYSKEDAGSKIWSEDGLSFDQKLAVTKNYDAVVPWSAVLENAKGDSVKASIAAKKMKATGIKVQDQPPPQQKFPPKDPMEIRNLSDVK